MKHKLFTLTFFALALLLIQATAVSAISAFLYWPDGTTSFQSVSPNQNINFNYTVTLVSTHQAQSEIKLIKNNDYANPVATVFSTTQTGVHYGAATVQASDLDSGSQYTLWIQSEDLNTGAQDFDLLDFQTTNTPPQFDPNMTLYYVYDIALVQSVNVVDLAQFASDADGDALTYTLDTTNSNQNVANCYLWFSIGTPSVAHCDLQAVGITSFDAIVSDSKATDQVTIVVEVINSSIGNGAPQFDANMTLFYSYNINLGSVSVVDLATVASDPDGNPLTFTIDQTNTNTGIVSCSLTSGSVLGCTLNGLGTTTLDAIVSDGQLTDTVTITINVFNITQNNPPFWNSSLQLNYAYNINLGNVNVVDLSLYGIDPNNDPLTYSINTAATNTGIISCTLNSGSVVNCNLNGLGTTTLQAIVSDGQVAVPITLTITVFNQTPPNNPPYWNSSLQLSYTYDLAFVQQAQVVDLSLYGIDPDMDPLTYLLNVGATNPAVTTCSLLGGTIVDCAFNGVGTTTVEAIVTDGQSFATTLITINVINSSTPVNNAPYYVNLNTVTVQPTGMQFIYDLQAHSVDPDNDPTTNGFNLGITNPTIINYCLIIGTGQLYCNVVGTGTTQIAITVSDGQLTTTDILNIVSTAVPNNPPYFSSSMQLSYSYNINLGSVSVVDLSQFGLDADNDPLTYTIDTTNTNNAVVTCSLAAGSVITCALNGLGTTTLQAIVNDGQASTAVTITITVFQPAPAAPVAVISKPSNSITCDATTSITFDGSQSYSPDNTPINAYFWTVFDLAGNVVAQGNAQTWMLTNCLPNGRYTVYLSVVDADGLVGTAQKTLRITTKDDFSDSNEEGLRVDVEVWGTDFEQACVAGCGQNQLEVIGFVENKNSFKIDDLRMTYTIPEYGIRYTSYAVDVTPGDATTIELLIELPYDIEPGIYYPTISFSDGEIRRVKPGYLEILG